MLNTDKKPFVIIDSCFVLEKLNYDDYSGFLEQCGKLTEIKDARVIFPPGTYKEVEELLEKRFEYNSYSHEGLKTLSELEGKENHFNNQDLMLYAFLKEKAKIIGKRLKRSKVAKDLSYRDCSICAHSLILSREGDVVIATRDELLADTSEYIYDNVTRKAFVQRGYEESRVVRARDMPQLMGRIEELLVQQDSNVTI